MPRFDANNSLCRIYPKRAGVLGAVGHDLEVGVADYSIDVDPGALRIDARFAPASVYVIDAVDGGRLRPGTLSAHDKAAIDRHIADDILHAARFPAIAFHSTDVEARGGDYHVHGRLELHGRTRDLAFTVKRTGDRLAADVVLHQPDFDIRPFRAFAGALRIVPELRVHVALTWPAESSPPRR